MFVWPLVPHAEQVRHRAWGAYMTIVSVVSPSPVLTRGLAEVLHEEGIDAATITPVLVLVAGGQHGDLVEKVVGVIQEVVEDDPPLRHPDLSSRENEVLQRIADGLTQQQIAQSLGISRHTVDTYLRRIRTKLGLGNKAELTRAAVLGHRAGPTLTEGRSA
ncbi:LuxR family transcriptional regulator [Nonomuraea longispora]|uniref:LuxR family transcriptional regulator n=2 Tax=Nonomuraea longispora TaxID=1848320 RepID=A0A4V2XLI1_9ACTN|nr:LuxR family transcriptional regulator [Nonomuraea longispora]